MPPTSFDHLVGAAEQRRRHGKPERAGGFEIDHQFEFCWLHDRQVGRLRSLEDLSNINSSLANSSAQTGTVTNQAARYSELSKLIARRDGVACCQPQQLTLSGDEERIIADHERVELKAAGGPK